MKRHFEKLANLTVKRITRERWEAYRDFYKGLKNPNNFDLYLKNHDLDDPATYDKLFAATIDKDNYVMFGLWDGEKMVGQTSLFFEDTAEGAHAVFAGSERADEYEGKGLGDEFYDMRKKYLRDHGFIGKVITTMRPNNKGSFEAAARNGFINTGRLNEHGHIVFELAEPL